MRNSNNWGTTPVRKKRNLNKLKLHSLKTMVDTAFSRFIRERDNHTCYTCGKVLHPKKSQNGHYISRSYLALRYDERNCHCQGVECNVFKNGNMAVYALRLTEQYGQEILRQLENDKYKIVGGTRQFLLEILKKYGD